MSTERSSTSKDQTANERRGAPLVQPWPVAGQIGTTVLGTMLSGNGVYVKDAEGRNLIKGPITAPLIFPHP